MGSILNIEAVAIDATELGLSRSECEDVLAVAYLATRADRRLSEEEIDSFERLVAVLLGPTAAAGAATELMDRFALQIDRRGLSPLLEEVTARLTRVEARHEAYKLAYAMSLSDLDTNDDEFRFEGELRAALGITEDGAEALIDEVIEAIEADEDDEEEG